MRTNPLIGHEFPWLQRQSRSLGDHSGAERLRRSESVERSQALGTQHAAAARSRSTQSQHAVRSTQYAVCSRQYAVRSTQQAVRSRQYAARSTQHAAPAVRSRQHAQYAPRSRTTKDAARLMSQLQRSLDGEDRRGPSPEQNEGYCAL